MSEVLKNLLAAAQLPGSEAETAAYETTYVAQRAAVDALYEVSAAATLPRGCPDRAVGYSSGDVTT